MNLKILEFLGKKVRPVELALIIKYLLRLKRLKFQLADGRYYYIDQISDFGLRIQKNLEYEPEMSEILIRLLEEGDNFVDLGSNEGYFSVLAAHKIGKKGKVFSIEPQERLWKIILKNSSINNTQNIQLIPFGIGSKKSIMKMQLYPTTNTGASGFSSKFNFNISFSKLRRWLYGRQESILITMDDLEHIFPSTIKLIKIDIEGFEYEALIGSKRLLEKKVFKNILIEIHFEILKRLGKSETDIDEFLAQYSYKKTKVSNNLNLYSA